MATSMKSVDSVFSQVAYTLRFELTFVVCALVCWALGGLLRRHHDQSRKPSKLSKEQKSIPTSHVNSSEQRAGRSATQSRRGGSEAAQVSKHSNSTLIRRGAGPEDILRGYDTTSAEKLRGLSEDARCEYFTEVFTAAVRTGRASKLPRYFKDAVGLHAKPSPQQLESVVKMCTAKRHLREALTAFDASGIDFNDAHACTASTWSCLLFCAVEVGDFDRCQKLYASLQEVRELSCEDFINMLRYVVHKKDETRVGQLLQDVRHSSSPPNNIAYNRALAICVSSEQLGMAEQLLSEMRQRDGVCDVITYNTLMKGYAQAGQVDRCFELFEGMTKHGIEASEVSFGILLDACIGADQLERAAQVFKIFQDSGHKLNAVLYTTLLKGLARAGQLDQAMHVFEQMCSSEVAPDLVAFSVLIKAHCDKGKVEIALALLERMTTYGLTPDEIVFNNLLLGCAERRNSALGYRIFTDMQRQGLHPSNVTLSIMIKIFVNCREWDAALELLNTSKEKLGLASEGRLYTQLAQACVRDRQGKKAVEVVEALLRRCSVDEATNGRLVQQCVSFNMLDSGAELLDKILSLGGRVSAKDANALLGAAVRKKKVETVRATLKTMERAGLPIDAQHRGSALSLHA